MDFEDDWASLRPELATHRQEVGVAIACLRRAGLPANEPISESIALRGSVNEPRREQDEDGTTVLVGYGFMFEIRREGDSWIAVAEREIPIRFARERHVSLAQAAEWVAACFVDWGDF